MAAKFLQLALVAFPFTLALATDPLRDFCVADPNNQVLVNGKVCKDPKMVQANDFYFGGLHVSANTSNSVGSKSTLVTTAQIPGLNTLGISIARLDFAPWGINPPHTHPRATEILTVLEGTVEVAFMMSNPENCLIGKVLQKGDVFVFPVDHTTKGMWVLIMQLRLWLLAARTRVSLRWLMPSSGLSLRSRSISLPRLSKLTRVLFTTCRPSSKT